MKTINRAIVSVFVCTLIALPATASLTPTGVAGEGALDTNYTLSINGGAAFAPIGYQLPYAWVTAPAGTDWIVPATPGDPMNWNAPVGDYVYTLTFSNPGVNKIYGTWATDNSGEIFLNGVTTGITKDGGGYTSLDAFEISGPFLSNNVLEFRLYNYGGPAGLLVSQLSEASPVPVPGALLLGFVGLGAAGLRLRKSV